MLETDPAVCTHSMGGARGAAHCVCGTWGAGSLSCVCVACWQGLAGVGGWKPLGAAVRVSPSTCTPSKPQGPRAPADALSRCSTAPLPGEGSTVPGKGELILDPIPQEYLQPHHSRVTAWAAYSVLAPIAQPSSTLPPAPASPLGLTQASCSGPDAVTWDKVMPCLINALGHGSISANPHPLPCCRVPGWAGQNSFPKPYLVCGSR